LWSKYKESSRTLVAHRLQLQVHFMSKYFNILIIIIIILRNRQTPNGESSLAPKQRKYEPKIKQNFKRTAKLQKLSPVVLAPSATHCYVARKFTPKINTCNKPKFNTKYHDVF